MNYFLIHLQIPKTLGVLSFDVIKWKQIKGIIDSGLLWIKLNN